MNPLATSKYQYEYEQMKSILNETIRDLATRINNLTSQAGLTYGLIHKRNINYWVFYQCIYAKLT